MLSKKPAGILEHLRDATDRRRREGTYPAINYSDIEVCAIICSADAFVAIGEFGRSKRKFVKQSLDLIAGIPSYDRFNPVLWAIKPTEFDECVLSWTTVLDEVTNRQAVPTDGKTLRSRFDARSSKAAIHMAMPCATANCINEAQVVLDEKCNEIMATRTLLDIVNDIVKLSGPLVTIDVTEYRAEIPGASVEANSVSAVKPNQPTLHDALTFCADHRADDFACVRICRHETHEHRHSRDATRFCYVRSMRQDLRDKERWRALRAIGLAVNNTVSDGKQCLEYRCYILRLFHSAGRCAKAMRSHWRPDVTFQDDELRSGKEFTDANFSSFCHMAVSLLRTATRRKWASRTNASSRH